MGFVRGTLIQSDVAMVPVESLKQGSFVRKQTGELVPCRWIAFKRLDPTIEQSQDFWPIKISAGALDKQVPLRDLYLSPDQAVLVSGHLVHARALVNGTSIVKVTEWAGHIDFYHIETEGHDIIDAQGLACETYIDHVSRRQFDNFAEFEAAFGQACAIPERPLPRVKFRRQLPKLIAMKLGIAPFAPLSNL